MIVLGVDTTISTCSVALADGLDVVSLEENTPSKQAEMLVPLIEKLLRQNQILYQDIDLLVATIGPGSFTGLRIGMAVVKSLSLTLGKPVVGVSSLQVMAQQAIQNNDHNIVAIINAMRGEFYVQKFDNRLRPLYDGQLVKISDIQDFIAENDIVASNAIDLLKDNNIIPCTYLQASPHAKSAVLVGLDYFTKNGADEQIMPLYIRKPDAKLPQNKK